MTAGLRALLEAVIDYAGLFPPAKLPLQEAVREYLELRESPEAWMLGRFVIPAGRVAELEAWEEELFRVDRPLELSLLGRSGATATAWMSQFHADLNTVRDFLLSHSDGVAVPSWELPLPVETDAETILGMIDANWERDTDSVETDIFLEVPGARADDGRRGLIGLIAARRNERPRLGFKLRTGGQTADAFPSVEKLADIVLTCHEHKCPWKATAGLHHPLRHYDPKIDVTMHGFLNVLFAAVLAETHDLSDSALQEIVADEDAANFQVNDDGIRWRDYSATIEQIETTRRTTFQSFGSCSFDEPRDDLRRLGLL